MKLLLKCKKCKTDFEYTTSDLLDKCPHCSEFIQNADEEILSKLELFNRLKNIEFIAVLSENERDCTLSSEYFLKDIDHLKNLFYNSSNDIQSIMYQIVNRVCIMIDNSCKDIESLNEINNSIQKISQERTDERNKKLLNLLEENENA